MNDSDILPKRQHPDPTNQRFVSILSDAGFKAVFGDIENVEVLVDLLNTFLPRKIATPLSFSTSEIEGLTTINKSVRLDLHCVDADNIHYIIEMQCQSLSNFFKRAVFYSSRVYSSNLNKGRKYEELPEVYMVVLLGASVGLNHRKSFWNDKFVSQYALKEINSYDNAPYSTIFINFVELYRFKKQLKDCRNSIERWLYALANMGKLEDIPEEMRNDESLVRLFKAAEIAGFSKEKYEQYNQTMMYELDYYDEMNTARAMGLAEGEAKGIAEGTARGRVEGIAEGRAKERAEVARNLKAMNMPAIDIATATGLSLEEISAL